MGRQAGLNPEAAPEDGAPGEAGRAAPERAPAERAASRSEDARPPPATGEEAAGGVRLPAPLARAAELALERKARDVLVLDLREVSNATDYFLILSGSSDTHVKGVSEHILEELRREGVRANHVEGLRSGRWVLLDYIDFVVHVFHPDARAFYQLENLWGDAPRERLTA